MQELIEELHRVSEDVPVPLELPEHDQVVDAQEQILMPLPADFREFLMTCGDVVFGAIEPVTVADPQSHTYLPEVTSQAWEEGMPRELICVCFAEGGYYALDQGGVVKFWQGGELDDREWETIWEWVEDIWLQA